MTDKINRRHAVRGLLYDTSTQRILLIQMLVPDSKQLIWLAPGGGIEPDESVEMCLFRELAEETGFQPSHCGPSIWQPPIWRRRHQFLLNGENWDQSEEFYLIETGYFEPISTNNPAKSEAQAFRAFKWWSVEEIEAASEQIFVPMQFATYFRQLVVDGPPSTVIDVGI